MAEPNALLRQKDAAAYLGVSVRYLRARKDIKTTTIPSVEGTRPLLRYRVADLDAWVNHYNTVQKHKRVA
jgi:hypothetical protein